MYGDESAQGSEGCQNSEEQMGRPNFYIEMEKAVIAYLHNLVLTCLFAFLPSLDMFTSRE